MRVNFLRYTTLVITVALQVTQDIEDAESFLDQMNWKTVDASELRSDPEQLIAKLAEEEVCIQDLLPLPGRFMYLRWFSVFLV